MGTLTVAKHGYEGHLTLAVIQTVGFKAFGKFSFPEFIFIFLFVFIAGTIEENLSQICNCFWMTSNFVLEKERKGQRYLLL